MFLDISQLRGGRDRIDRRYPPSAFDPEEGAYRVVAPVALGFEISSERNQFRLVGRVATVLELSCSRCLEPFRLPLDEAFDLLFLPQRENTGEGESEVEEDDLGTAFYRDETIDLGGLMRERFVLAVPMKPLCADGCRGLCPQCGTNLNTATCQCVRRWTDPRLAELGRLVPGDEREPTH